MKNYWPLAVLVGVSALAGFAIAPLSIDAWMHAFMGVALIIFASLKLFNPSKFADGFQMYDLLAKPFRPYAYVYPYIELFLGLAWLAQVQALVWVYWATVIVFGFGALGVLFALKRGLNVNCACMGNVLNVPLSHVTLGEDVAMIAMSAYMLAAI